MERFDKLDRIGCAIHACTMTGLAVPVLHLCSDSTVAMELYRLANGT